MKLHVAVLEATIAEADEAGGVLKPSKFWESFATRNTATIRTTARTRSSVPSTTSRDDSTTRNPIDDVQTDRRSYPYPASWRTLFDRTPVAQPAFFAL